MTNEAWIGRCDVLIATEPCQAPEPGRVLAAAWCDGPRRFRELLGTHLLQNDMILADPGDPLPAQDWVAQHGPVRQALDVVRRVSAATPTAAVVERQDDALPEDIQEDALDDTPGMPFPRLRPPEREKAPPQGRTTLALSPAQERDMARQWHLSHPDFTLSILEQSGLLTDASPDGRDTAFMYMQEAVSIGFFSKKDIVQYTGACLYAGGSIATVPSFRDFLKNFRQDCPDIMQRFMEHTPIVYWTYLPRKVKKNDRGL